MRGLAARGAADWGLAGLVVAILGTLVVPMPEPVLDVLLAANLGFASLVLVSVMMVTRPLALSTFPTLLLVTTLFRLALNVSTTRMILSTGSAGSVVTAFGRFVLRGDVGVGLVVFLVLTLVQFLVIAKGAERVAEVGARFTLDAMPGKQMAIDADLRNGALDDAEARRQRDELGREAQFHGSMDGAMKFVKGDAIAGLVITAVNLVAGLGLGTLRDDLPLTEAIEVYSTLTVGDGLVAQIPSLFVSLSAGLLTTRVVSPQEVENLAERLGSELFSAPRPLAVGAAFSLMLASAPGLPAGPFLIIGLALGARAWVRRASQPVEASEEAEARALAERQAAARKQRSVLDRMAPSVSLVTIELGPDLSEAFGFGAGRDDATELLGELVPQLREAVFLDTGVRVPGARIRTHVPHLTDGRFRVLVKEVEVFSGDVDGGAVLALCAPRRLARLGREPAREMPHPVNGATCSLLPAEHRAEVERLGIRTWSAQGYVALCAMAQIRRHLDELVGVQEVADLVEQARHVYPALVEETVPKRVELPRLTEVLRRLAAEGVSVRDLRSILDAIARADDAAGTEAFLAAARAALRRSIVDALTGGERSLGVVLVHPGIEDAVESAAHPVPGGLVVGLEPDLRLRILEAVAAAIEPTVTAGARPVFLTRATVRGALWTLLRDELPGVAVLGPDDLPPDVEVHPLALVQLAEEAGGLPSVLAPWPEEVSAGSPPPSLPRAEAALSPEAS